MTTLREQLVLTEARAISLLRQVTKDGNTFVLLVRGPLTPDLADTLRCRNQIYNLNDNPYPNLKVFTLDHEISNCELTVPGTTGPCLRPTVATGFSIKPNEAADADGDLELHFRMKFSTGKVELNALLDAVADNPFDLSLMALQGGLFDAIPTKGDGPEGGSRVNMSGDKPDEDFQEEPPAPLVQQMMDGNEGLVDEVISGSGTLPSAREMAGGTTGELKRTRGPRRSTGPVAVPSDRDADLSAEQPE